MVVIYATWQVSPADRGRVLGDMRRLLEPTRTREGCRGCRLSTDTENPNIITYWEDWDDRALLDSRLREDSVRVLLSVLELSVAQPVVRLLTVLDDAGVEAIAKARSVSQ